MAPGTPGDPARSWGNGHVHRAKLGIKVQQKFLQGLQPISRLARGQKTTAQGAGMFFFGAESVHIKTIPLFGGNGKHGPKIIELICVYLSYI